MDLLLAPMTGNLTFAEVVDRVLDENWHREESSLANLHHPGTTQHLTMELHEIDDNNNGSP